MIEDEPQIAPEHESNQHIRRWVLVSGLLAFMALCALSILWFCTTPPPDFVAGTTLEITPGMSARSMAEQAAEKSIVRSPLLLFAILVHRHDPTSIYAGTYRFVEAQSVFGVASQIASQRTEEDLLRITFPEGIPVAEMARIAEAWLPNVDSDEYTKLATEREGYLFPETYFVPKEFTAEDLVELQATTFADMVKPLAEDIERAPLSEYEIITLASIVEREANDERSMKMVAGILLNRLEIGMALQADATIEYVLDTPLNELPPGQLAAELRETDSPYNTYQQPGLPPTPIGNPGLQSIEAVINPTPSDYLFYITGTDGEFYYATTLQEHNANIARYLR